MKNRITSAGTDVDSQQKTEVTTSSPNNAKPTVGCCTSLGELIQWCIINAFNVESQDGTKYVTIDYEEMQSQLDYFVQKEKFQIVAAFEAGMVKSNTSNRYISDIEAEQYFNNTFK